MVRLSSLRLCPATRYNLMLQQVLVKIDRDIRVSEQRLLLDVPRVWPELWEEERHLATGWVIRVCWQRNQHVSLNGLHPGTAYGCFGFTLTSMIYIKRHNTGIYAERHAFHYTWLTRYTCGHWLDYQVHTTHIHTTPIYGELQQVYKNSTRGKMNILGTMSLQLESS